MFKILGNSGSNMSSKLKNKKNLSLMVKKQSPEGSSGGEDTPSGASPGANPNNYLMMFKILGNSGSNMSSKLKNKKNLSLMVKKQSPEGSSGGEDTPSGASPGANSAKLPIATPTQRRQKRYSAGNLQDLLQCPLCLEKLINSRMLPCQHTFCYACIKTYATNLPKFECPVCWVKYEINDQYIDSLPSNLYIDSLLQVMSSNTSLHMLNGTDSSPPETPSGATSVDLIAATSNSRCVTCKAMCDVVITKNCKHCKQSFCPICWSDHLDDLKTQIGSILKQLDSSMNRLTHKVENYRERWESVMNQIEKGAEEKIKEILERKNQLIQEAGNHQRHGEMSALGLKTTLDEARNAVASAMSSEDNTITDNEKIKSFLKLHRNALGVIADVSKWEGKRFCFDKDSFTIENVVETSSEIEEAEIGGGKINALDGEESLITHYKTRNFVPHYIWRKTSRPGGVACSPWNDSLYICGMDSHSVLIVERSQAKIVSKLSCEEMLCPVHITFLKTINEIYVTDKWKHCVHVFTANGVYLRSMGTKGSRPGQFRSPEGITADNTLNKLYVVDTGNDRVQVLESDGTYLGQLGLLTKSIPDQSASIWQQKEAKCNEFNAPTDVAIFGDRIIVLDSGNKRVKIYNKNDRSKIHEFGSFGTRKGQLRQPEVLTVDPFGFIVVGDSGNSRVQVFKTNGTLVRVFGGSGSQPGKFGWISGLYITPQLDFIISDTKNHSVNFF